MNSSTRSLFNNTFTLESCIGMKYSMVVNRLVSSAKSINLNVLLTLGRSLIYIKNNNGPRIDPCGTPVVIGPIVDESEFISTY